MTGSPLTAEAARRPLTHGARADGAPLTLAEYTALGGYQAARTALCSLAPGDVTKLVKDAGLLGRGGAGFPTGAKWSFVPMGDDAPQPKYLIANADEMEPGTFKDRILMETNPHQFIEGMMIAAFAIQATEAVIFLRWAYKRAARALE